MAVLNFNGYRVNHSNYTRNENFFSENQNLELKQNLNVEMSHDDNAAEIRLVVLVGSLTEDSQPFKIEANLSGFFTYEADEDKNETGIEETLKVNGTAILYPYLRSLVSTLTNMSGEFPGYNMPTINVYAMLKEESDDNGEPEDA